MNLFYKPGLWIGEGKITFSASPDHVRVFTRWTYQNQEDPNIHVWSQEVEMHGQEDKIINNYVFTPLTDTTFSVSLHNEVLGKSLGKGVIDNNKIAWEIRSTEIFQGIEVYELQENGDYMMHAEYAAQDNFRTIIDGRIWKKST